MPNHLVSENSPYLLQHANNPVDWYPWDKEALEAAIKNLLDSYDWGYGGWGSAPKFLQPMTIEFLLRRATTDTTQREQILKAVSHALNAMSRGGMYDVVGGGFSRYSVDNFWRTPHFE